MLNRLFVQHSCQTGCQTGLTTGLTTVLNEQPLFVQPVVKPGCTTGLISKLTYFDQNRFEACVAEKLCSAELYKYDVLCCMNVNCRDSSRISHIDDFCTIILRLLYLRQLIDLLPLVRQRQSHIFTARRNARIASAVLATAIPSVCLSVCLSVTRL